MTRIKMCGITRPEDAVAAAEAGASAIGLVFWPASPRAVSVAQARTIVRALPPLVAVVGVFVNQPIDEVNAVAVEVGLSAVQLHGDEPAARVSDLCRPIIKSLPLPADDRVLEAWPAEVTLLVDACDPVRRGGTGRQADWRAAALVARQRRVILAGGLSAANVADAIRAVGPWAVDVSSGVEAAPGIKDAARMWAFCEAVRTMEGAGA